MTKEEEIIKEAKLFVIGEFTARGMSKVAEKSTIVGAAAMACIKYHNEKMEEAAAAEAPKVKESYIEFKK